jgi:hypothetical protein
VVIVSTELDAFFRSQRFVNFDGIVKEEEKKAHIVQLGECVFIFVIVF